MYNIGELYLVIGLIISLIIYTITKEEIKNILTFVIINTIFILLSEGEETQITEWLVYSEMIRISKILVLLLAIPFIRRRKSEYQIIMGLTILGVILLISAANMISFYLALELQSLGSYLLATYKKTNEEEVGSRKSTEAGLKYFILGAIASGIILFGLSLIYGFTGIMNIETIMMMEEFSKGTITGIIFVMVGLLFKIAAAPFHGWAPDVYEGSPTEVTGFFAVVPKISIILMIIRIIIGTGVIVEPLLIGSGIMSLIIGGLGALYQKNIKRLFGYSTILNIGFILIGIGTGTIEGIEAALTYIIIYMITNLAIFSIILVIPKDDFNIEDLTGLGKKNTILSMCLTIALFSTAGIPPLAGFLGKYLVIKGMLNEEMYTVTTIVIIISVISAAYYIRIIQLMYFRKEESRLGEIIISKEESIIIGISIMIILILLGKPGWILMLVDKMVTGWII